MDKTVQSPRVAETVTQYSPAMIAASDTKNLVTSETARYAKMLVSTTQLAAESARRGISAADSLWGADAPRTESFTSIGYRGRIGWGLTL
jgi:hypothetical protein